MVIILWSLLAAVNLIIQLRYFSTPSPGLYTAKRISTPTLLVCAALVIVITSGEFLHPETILLLAMGLGELGIEGSSVVESEGPRDGQGASWMVTAAGVLFLLVNLTLGTILLLREPSLLGLLTGAALVVSIVLLLGRLYQIPGTILFQIRVYSIGLAVLAAGAFSSLFSGPEGLGIAGLLLTISDSLVLWRMGADWDSESPAGCRRLRSFLVVILLLYYSFMAVMIQSASPFVNW